MNDQTATLIFELKQTRRTIDKCVAQYRRIGDMIRKMTGKRDTATLEGEVLMVVDAVEDYFGFGRGVLLRHCRRREAAWARHVAIWVALETIPHLTLECAGRAFKRHHTAIMNSRERMRGFISIKDARAIKDTAMVLNKVRGRE